MIGLFSLDLVLLLANLIFAIYISIYYFVRLKVKGAFILLFYIFVDLTTIARILEISFILADLVNNRDGNFYAAITEKRVEICRSIAYLTFFGLGLVVVSTMFQIGISLQILSLEINALSAKRR